MTARNPLALVQEAKKSIPVNLEELARQLGVSVSYKRLDDDLSGYIHKDGDQWEIAVNARHAPTRQRFTLAHELGHFVLHRNKLGEGTNDTKAYRADANKSFYNSAIERRHEREANQFAAGLLMPTNQVVNVFRNIGVNNPERMASLFGVSPAAMEIRIESLSKRSEI